MGYWTEKSPEQWLREGLEKAATREGMGPTVVNTEDLEPVFSKC
jgi:hypothetical protein